MQIKQYSKVKYFGYLLDETMPGEAMALNIMNKSNNNLKFLCRRNSFLIVLIVLRCLFCNALIHIIFVMHFMPGIQI